MTDDASPDRSAGRWWWLAAGVVAVAVVAWSSARTAPRSSVAPESPQVTLSSVELEYLERERRRLVSEVEHEPPISAQGLSSPEAIAANEKRFAALSSVTDRMRGQSAPEGNRAPSREVAAAKKQKSLAERALYQASGELLGFLRASWGQWRFDDGAGLQVRFASEDGQSRLKEFGDRLRLAQADLDRVEADLRVLSPTPRNR